MIHAVLDEALVCHVGVTVDGTPRVMPTAHVRLGEHLYLHGARANGFMRALAGGAEACVTATLVDGLVFARSAMHHSMNFRSVVLYGRGRVVEDTDEKRRALLALVDHMAPGRSTEARPPIDAELGATLVVRLPIEEASAKVRSGPPVDAAADLSLDVWAGELPLALAAPVPLSDGATSPSVLRRAEQLAPRRDPAVAYERSRDGHVVSCDPRRVDFDLVHRFLAEESYWARGVDRNLQRAAMDRCLGFGLYRGTQQLGYARVVTDRGRFAYLGDVFEVSEDISQVREAPAMSSW